MRTILNRWISTVRNCLNLSAIERNIADSKRDIAEIRKVMEDQELRASGVQALLANQQQHLEIMINELDKSMREVGAMITNESNRKNEAELKFSRSIIQLSNEIKQLCKIVDEHLQSNTLK